MKLWVDDIRNAPDDSWTVARTVNSAINCIAQFGNQITEISLDHDISHQVTVGTLGRPYPCEETFKAVAWFIAFRYSGHLCPAITIHSSNIVGGQEIERIIRERLDPPRITHAPMGLANRLEMEV